MAAEVDRRIFQRTWDPTCRDEWRTCNHSWNHVCNGAIIRAALYMIDDPGVLAHTIHGCIQNMTYGLGGFTDDGGCVEGPGYWAAGFGNFMEAALALRMKTAGELNLMHGEKIERICRYPLSIHIAGPVRAAFADSHEGYLAALPAILVNQFFDIPELYELCETNKDGSLKLTGMHDLTLYNGAKAKGQADQADYLLPDLGQVKLRGAAGRKQLTLVALAGHNGVSHNHNDVGSFVVHKNGRLWLVDPGGPVYTRKTFSEQRYEIVFCNSLGHSVPLIDGVQQAAGAQYRGELSVENLNGAGIKRAVIDMTRAYPEGTVNKLLRTLVLNSDTNMLTLEDVFEFGKAPKSIQEAFITFENVTVARNRQSVRIGPKRDGIEIKAVDTRGTFRADLLADESKEGRTGHVVTRITFEPKGLGTEVVAKFQIG